MYDFYFAYSDGRHYEVENVSKIVVEGSSSLEEIIGDAILSAKLPLKTTYLYTDDGNHTVSGTNLMVIDVKKHQDR